MLERNSSGVSLVWGADPGKRAHLSGDGKSTQRRVPLLACPAVKFDTLKQGRSHPPVPLTQSNRAGSVSARSRNARQDTVYTKRSD